MTVPERVLGVVGKVERAQEQIKDLNVKLDAHITKGTGHSLVGYADRSQDIPQLYSRLDGPPTPLWIAIRVGEIVHQLRSSLDHLAWQLVLVNNQAPGRHTEFPIFDDWDKYKLAAPAKIKGVSDRAQTLIENAQPFKWGADAAHKHPLWHVYDLDRIDKHQVLLEARTNAIFDGDFVNIWLAKGDTPAPYPIPPPNPEVNVGSQPRIYIVLQYGGRTEPIIPALQVMLDGTKGIIDTFAPEFI